MLSLRALASFAAARQEVEAGGGWYGVMYSTHPSSGGVPSMDEEHSLAVARALVGADRVYVVGTRDIEAAFGPKLLAEQKRMFGGHWAWATNDAVDAAW